VILVLDAGPLITLARIGTLELLHRSAEQIFIPEAVYRECVTQAQGRPGSDEIARAPWIVRQAVQDQTTVTRLRSRVGWGEAEAIVLARQLHADAVVLDDSTARRVAEEEGCAVVGLLGLIVNAKRQGLIPTVKPLLNAMRQENFFMTDALQEAILRQAGEDPRH